MRGTLIVALALAFALALAPAASAHLYNHQTKHRECDALWMEPHGHYIGDGHRHTHDPEEVKKDPVQYHPHNPCNQVRMAYPNYEPVAPIMEVSPPTKEIDPKQIIWNDGDPTNSEVYVGGEAYQFPIKPGSFKEVDAIVISSDADAAALSAQGLISGTGTSGDPYIIENFIVGDALAISDTTKCFVVRNNIVVDRVVEAPLVPDPDELVNVTQLIKELLELIEGLLADIAEWLGITEEWKELKQLWDENATIWDAEKAVWDAQDAVWSADRADLEAQLDQFQQEHLQWQQAINDYHNQYLGAVLDTEQLAADFEYYIEHILGHEPAFVTQPVQDHQAYIVDGAITDLQGLQTSFERYQDEASSILGAVSQDGWQPTETVHDVRDMIEDTDPGSSPPPGYPGTDYAQDLQRYQDYRTWIQQEIEAYWEGLKPAEPDMSGYEDFLARYNTFQQEYNKFVTDHNAFLAAYDAFLDEYGTFAADYDDFLAQYASVIDHHEGLIADAQAKVAESRALIDAVKDFAWKLGDLLFKTIEQVLEYLLNLVFELIDPEDPNEVANNNGQLVLDWNGQCLHVYNNVINDLRVNQNNDRTGFATGGVIENNRIYTIGQIRHYDGIFRENEVGNRAHLYSLVDPSIQAPANDQSVNNDGANQGWYFDNIIYGNVDLDFHGHHHSDGFYSPISHYHGSTRSIGYMVAPSGGCSFDYGDIGMPPMDESFEQDDDIEVLGETVVPGDDRSNDCLPHHDHSKRWTSVFFTDNVVIDPNGQGIRFEDENHRADDEEANSENMEELKIPHFHQKYVQVEDNSIVGRIFVDVLNAKGTFLWSDDFEEVQNTQGVARTEEALDHPGARIVYSHPLRNDAWVDITRNTVFLTQPSGLLVSDAEFMTQLQVKDNRAFGVPPQIKGMDFEELRDWLWDARSAPAATVKTGVDSWGPGDRGTQTFAVLRNVIDDFDVIFCGNYLDGLDNSLTATDRIYQDGVSAIDTKCTPDDDEDDRAQNVLNGAKAPAVSWIPAPEDRPKLKTLRQIAESTDSFYILDLAVETAEALLPPVAIETVNSVPVTL